jgi:hypothetical protein
VKSPHRHKAVRALLALAATALVGAAVPAASSAAGTTDPNQTCSPTLSYDTSIDSWNKYYGSGGEGNNPQAVVPLGYGAATNGGGASANGVGSDPANPQGRNLSSVLMQYADHLVEQTKNSTRVRIIKKNIGVSSLGRPIAFYVVGTPEHINNLDGPNGDAAFWQGVRAGDISQDEALEAAVTRPAFGWITATPHGDESAAGESITRQLYELAARTDCQNTRRLTNMDLFIQLVRNPDGRDAVTRTTAWAFDPNRDFGTRHYVENSNFIPLMNQYPGLFFIDAHQQGGDAYFFPPNEDPVHHEISSFTLNTVQDKIGPALQKTFNDQSTLYRNYNQYDLFTPEYGDTVPSLIMGAAGMTYEKGNAEAYTKQVYDHYLAIDQTINTISNDKVNTTREWVRQWNSETPDPGNPNVNAPGQDLPYGAVEQGKDCNLQPNKLKSPLHDTYSQIPTDTYVCGYYYRPDQHTGDVASLLTDLQEVGVKVFRLNSSVTLDGVKDYGKAAKQDTLPAGTLYIPMAQGMKHWIQAVLGENPYIPYPFYYDVVTWSYGLQRGLAGDGFLTKPGSVPTDMTQISSLDEGGAPSTASPVYAFNTDSMNGLALAAELLAKGVNVYRGTTAFDANGKHYFTGAALVDAASLSTAGADLSAMAKKRQTPVYGLDRYPVARKQMTVPKIGVYTGATLIPSNPLYVSGANVSSAANTAKGGTSPGHCAMTSGGANFCEALFTLREKDGLPASTVVPLTTTDIDGGALASGGFTALVNANYAITSTTTNTAIRNWVNGGGRYVSYGTNGGTAARNAGLTNLWWTTYAPASGSTAQPVPAITKTPGSTYDATFDTTNPVAWGFDNGGWIYRQTADPMFDANSLNASYTTPGTEYSGGGQTFTNGASKAAVSYATDIGSAASQNGQKYGLSVNATDPGLLPGRPAVVTATVGSGVTTVLGFDPFYRAWKEQDERLVLNAAMYPTTAELGPTTAAASAKAAAEPALTQAKTEEAKPAVPVAKLPAVKKSTLRAASTDNDLVIVVGKKQSAALKKAVKKAKLPKKIGKKASFKTAKGKVTFTLKNVRTDDFHDREQWVSSLLKQLKKQKVKMLMAQL